MAAFARHRRFLGGFLCGAGAGAVASCWAAWRLLRSQSQAELVPERALPEEPVEESLLEKYGFPEAGTETRCYTNHALSYDQAKRVPRWVIEHISKQKTLGNADRRHCKFRPDPNIPLMFSAVNEDYLGSGWSRGHMAPAGDKFSTVGFFSFFFIFVYQSERVKRPLKIMCNVPFAVCFEVECGLIIDAQTWTRSYKRAMAETFYLSNIVPQNYENNAGFWNRMEMYCRELTERFEDVWVVSGPLTLPQINDDGKKSVTYQVIGKDDVAVPSHLYKVILARRSRTSTEPLVLGAFVVPNDPIGFSHQLTEFQVNIEDLEKMSGLVFFPQVDKIKDVKNICEVDTCKLMGFKEFTLYITARKAQSARTLHRLEKAMSELREAGIEPDEYLLKLHKKKEEELLQEKQVAAREGKAG
ncbi:nuclease EXOG, mitochondrial [Balearica regulorum gibbericeps]|uniref:nuclease EXOG, mitochondrial n=1 Tax=Balearica regulorum gibbericeps TaxID=100784 RepID=UPI003F5F58A4